MDIAAAESALDASKNAIRATHGERVLADIGSFGGLFNASGLGKDPVLVATADGVGTKIRIAAAVKKFDTVGRCLVQHCINDALVQGAEPLFFLDYYATGALNIDTAADVVTGIGKGCELAGCALVGGETAEMPGMYEGDDYDLAGFCVGVVEKSEIIDGSTVATGDILLGIESSGPHSNGYSLIRKILEVSGADLQQTLGNTTLGQALLTPTTIYVKALLALFAEVPVKALSHITGGGLLENLPRVLPKNCNALIETGSWQWPEIFQWLQTQGNVETTEMYRTFNCGVGMVLCIAPQHVEKALSMLLAAGHNAWEIGRITQGDNQVELLP